MFANCPKQACSFPNTMFSKIVFLLWLMANSNGFSREKRTDIDLQTCIDNFDIHRDKIIRTQDSRSMGAKYLTEFDLGTREECLRLCCETDNCDVFVFEEKNSGGCYLFHCGPPEDFKCKFTHHVNYSSAVLAINRHLPDLESQIKLTKHEQDLSQLRKPSDPETVAQAVETRTSPSTTSSTTAKPKQLDTKPSEEERKCSRYQFECRSTSECIAIYNACDGIPQCADGSDEAPELGCPEISTTPPSPPVHITNPIQPPRFESNIPAQPLHPLPPALSPPEMYRPQQVQRPPDFLRPLPNARIPFDNQPVQYAPAPIPMQPNTWGTHQIPQIPPYPDKNSHIFNHKENGLQVPDGQEISQIRYADQYPKANYYDNYRQPMQQESWPGNPEEVPYNAYPQDASNRDWQRQPVAKNPAYKTPPTSSRKENSTHEQEKMAHELKFHTKQNVPHDEPKIKIEKHKQHYPDVSSYKMNETGEDGAAATPSGAVLSLTLGLIITCIMALLIGCRLRVKRRLRKGGKSYAHDADYLVNGMYL